MNYVGFFVSLSLENVTFVRNHVHSFIHSFDLILIDQIIGAIFYFPCESDENITHTHTQTQRFRSDDSKKTKIGVIDD